MGNCRDGADLEVGGRVVLDRVPGNNSAAPVLYPFEGFLLAGCCCVRCLGTRVRAPCDGYLHCRWGPIGAAVNGAAMACIMCEHWCRGVVTCRGAREHEANTVGFVLTLGVREGDGIG